MSVVSVKFPPFVSVLIVLGLLKAEDSSLLGWWRWYCCCCYCYYCYYCFFSLSLVCLHYCTPNNAKRRLTEVFALVLLLAACEVEGGAKEPNA